MDLQISFGRHVSTFPNPSGCYTDPIQGGHFATIGTSHLSTTRCSFIPLWIPWLAWASMSLWISTQHAKQQEGLIIKVKIKEYYIT